MRSENSPVISQRWSANLLALRLLLGAIEVKKMDAHLSFLPMSVSTTLSVVRREVPASHDRPACSEVTTHKRTSDPRYIARIVESGYPDGRRLRSTLLIERASGKTVDHLHLISHDYGQTWKLHFGADGER
jgi:hypothetical protein